MSEKQMKVYVAHPYDGLEENKQRLETIIAELIKKYNIIPFSGIHSFGYLYSVVDFDTNLEYCLSFLSCCDEIWFCEGWEKSKGCRKEFEYAKVNKIPIKLIDFQGDIIISKEYI